MKKYILFSLLIFSFFANTIFAQTYKNVAVLSINITHGELIIETDKEKTDTTVEIKEYPPNVIEINNSGNILKISQKSNFDPLAFLNRVPVIKITMPESEAKEITVKTKSSSGAVNIKNVSVERLDIEAASNINLSGVSADSLTIVAKSSTVTINSSAVSNHTQIKTSSADIMTLSSDFSNMIEIETSSGSITMSIKGKATDYNYSLFSRMGKCYLNGGEINGNIINNAPNALNIRTKTGKVNINFY